MRHADFLVAACELLAAACMWDLVPDQGWSTESYPLDHQESPVLDFFKFRLIILVDPNFLNKQIALNVEFQK